MPELSAFSSQNPCKIFAGTSGLGALSFPATCGQCCHRPPPLCLCFGSVLLPTALARTWDSFHLPSEQPWLLPEKCGKGMRHGLEMQWAGGSVLPIHSRKWYPLESSSPSSQDSVSSNSVRKAYSVLEGGLFRDPCYGCSHSLSSFPCESGIPSFLQHEGRGELVAQSSCTPRQPTAGHGRWFPVVIIPTKPGLCPPGPAESHQAVLSWSLCLFLGCGLGSPVLKHIIHPARRRIWECNLSVTVPSEAGHLKVNIPALVPSFKSWEGMIALLAGRLSSGRLCFM